MQDGRGGLSHCLFAALSQPLLSQYTHGLPQLALLCVAPGPRRAEPRYELFG